VDRETVTVSAALMMSFLPSIAAHVSVCQILIASWTCYTVWGSIDTR